ncbi:transposase [Streptomyces sp. YGL11-2]|uniref:transposase n=1 Tax=Streptomyces sp. YGL11-2 TaxID=3414028 RepID=UPI003CED20AE
MSGFGWSRTYRSAWGGRFSDRHTAINGALFRLRTGIPRRDPPAGFGNGTTVRDRRGQWSADGGGILQAPPLP